MKSIVSSALAVTGLTLLLAACASNEKVASADDTTGKVCTVSYKTGSNMPTKECAAPMSDADRAEMLRNTREAMRPAPGYKAP